MSINQQVIPTLLIMLLPMATIIWVGSYAWRRRPAPGAVELTLLMLSTLAYSIPYSFQLACADLDQVLFWMYLSTPGAYLLGPLWLAFSLEYAGKTNWLKKRNYALLALLPLFATVVAWTNKWHGLYGGDFHLQYVKSFWVLQWSPGPVYWMNWIYILLTTIAGIVLLSVGIVNKGRQYRQQAIWLVIGALVPLVGQCLYILDFGPIPGLDLTPFTFLITGIAWGVALFGFGALEILPIASGMIVENMRAEQLLRIIPSAVYTLDNDRRITSFNAKAEEITGYSPEEIIGKPCTYFAYEPCRHTCGLFHEDVPKPITGVECIIRTKLGKYLTVIKNAELLLDTQGDVVGGVESFENISGLKQAQSAERIQSELSDTLREIGIAITSELDLQSVLDRIMELIGRVLPYDSINVILCEEDRWRIKRQRGYEKFGAAEKIEEIEFHLDKMDNFRIMVETRRPIVVPDTHLDPYWVVIEESLHIRSWAGAPIFMRGELLGFLSLDNVQPDAYSREIIDTLEVFSTYAGIALENARLHAEQQYRATHDPLTALPNRSLFFDRLNHALVLARRTNCRVAVLFIDLDGFKAVNDTWGHAVGDLLLQEVTLRVRGCIRESDTLARMGGDEFTIVLENVQEVENVSRVAKSVLAEIQRVFQIETHEIAITGSIGVSCYPEDGEGAEALLQVADTAMYRAKDSGRNCYIFAEKPSNAAGEADACGSR